MQPSRRFFLYFSIFVGSLLSIPMRSLAQCTQPPAITISFSWAPDSLVQVNNTTVPAAPLGTALSNWDVGLSNEFLCDPPAFSSSFTFPTAFVNLSYTASIPTACTGTNQIDDLNVTGNSIVRGCTDLNHAQFDSNHRLSVVNMYVSTQITNTSAITEVVAHEFGHTLSLTDCNAPGCPIGSSVMLSHASLPTVNSLEGTPGPTPCDLNAVAGVATDYSCPPPPPPNDPCLGGSDPGNSFGNGNGGDGSGRAPDCSPVILDIANEGFHLTSAANGVTFDIAGNGHPVQIAWTDNRFHNAFLALPGSDGLVHNGKELFGNFTSQPNVPQPNGFLALAQYDLPSNGGNGDGVIDAKDAIFSKLRLWIDANHDGICQPEELHLLSDFGIRSIALNYSDSRRVDEFGNLFRYRARVDAAEHWAFDVFLVTK